MSVSAFSALFIIVDIIIIAVGMLLGYLRGTGRSLVRLIYLTVIGIISFFTARAIAFSFPSKILPLIITKLPEDIQAMLAAAPNAITALENLVGAVLATVIIVAVFGLLQLLSLIGFRTISKKIVDAVYKKEEPVAGKWIGLGVGLVSAILVSTVLLSPIFSTLYFADNISPDTAVEYFGYDSEEDAEKAFKSSKLFPINKAVASAITSYKVPSSIDSEKKDNALKTAPAFIDLAKDAIEVHNATKELGGRNSDVSTNTIATATPYIDRSVTLHQIAVEMLISIANTLEDGGDVAGMDFINSDNTLIKDARLPLIEALKNTNHDNVKDNLISVFGDINGTIVLEKDKSVSVTGSYVDALKEDVESVGLFAAMNELKNKNLEGLPSEGTEMAHRLSLSIRHISANDNMKIVLDAIKNHVIAELNYSEFNLLDTKYAPIRTEIAAALAADIKKNLNGDKSVDVKALAEDVEASITAIFKDNNFYMDKINTNLLSTCMAKEFSAGEYVADGEVIIHADDIEVFFK